MKYFKDLFYCVSEENPYVFGALGMKAWNDRYMNMAFSIRNWQIAFFVAIAMSFILIIAMIRLALNVKVQPYVVETNHGMPYAIHAMKKIPFQDQRLVNFAMNQFIINTRSIIHDHDAEVLLLNKAYAYAANDTIPFLKNYYQSNNPFQLARHYTVSIKILNSMPISQSTWQIVWDESKQSTAGGYLLENSRWMANLQYQFGKINSHFLNDNPFGLYITALSWSKTQL